LPVRLVEKLDDVRATVPDAEERPAKPIDVEDAVSRVDPVTIADQFMEGQIHRIIEMNRHNAGWVNLGQDLEPVAAPEEMERIQDNAGAIVKAGEDPHGIRNVRELPDMPDRFEAGTNAVSRRNVAQPLIVVGGLLECPFLPHDRRDDVLASHSRVGGDPSLQVFL
jgi:hypothetical protein